MDSKQFHIRIRMMLILLAATFACFAAELYDLQYVHGSDYLDQSIRKIAGTQTVAAVRGQILDRYGRVLVDNRTSYQVSLNTSLMGEERNEILLSLLNLCRAAGISWNDSLPISSSAPFVYTLDCASKSSRSNLAALMEAARWRDGQVTVLITRLENQEAASSPVEEEASAFESSLAAASGDMPLNKIHTWYDLDGLAQDNGQVPLSAPAGGLLAQMRDTFGVEETLSDEDARALLGVLYELALRTYDVDRSGPYIFAQDVDIDFISAVKEHRLAGVEIDAVSVRAYNTTYAAHLLGRVGRMDRDEWEIYRQSTDKKYNMNDSVGKDGVELAFESYLRGSAGKKIIERNTNGKIVSETWIEEPSPGDNVFLTLDIRLQEALEQSLAQRIPTLTEQVQGGAGVVIDIKDGGVLAMASYPSFDLATIYQDASLYQEVSSDPLSPLLNRATQGRYSPGSTFKMIMGVAGLQEGVITTTERILDTGSFQYPKGEKYPYGDYHPRCWIYRQYGGFHGRLNLSEALRDSCNIYFYTVGDRLGIDKIDTYAGMFGLGKKTGIELEEKVGMVAGKETSAQLNQVWNGGDVLSASIGQGNTLCTPLQLANYIATLVNGGSHYAAHLMKSIKSGDFSQIVEEYNQPPLDQIEISEQNLEAVKLGMYMVANSSSVAKYFRDLPVKVGSKTGTAQVAANSEANAIFVCFAPYEDPEIAISLVAEKGGSGGELAAVAADVLAAYFSTAGTLEAVNSENTLLP